MPASNLLQMVRRPQLDYGSLPAAFATKHGESES
jgi:hypothetical protein